MPPTFYKTNVASAAPTTNVADMQRATVRHAASVMATLIAATYIRVVRPARDLKRCWIVDTSRHFQRANCDTKVPVIIGDASCGRQRSKSRGGAVRDKAQCCINIVLACVRNRGKSGVVAVSFLHTPLIFCSGTFCAHIHCPSAQS